MNLTITILIVFLTCCLYLIWRSIYTYRISTKAVNAVFQYCMQLIDKQQYDDTIDYYDSMLLSYDEYFINFKLHGVINMIKPECRELLSSYIEP